MYGFAPSSLMHLKHLLFFCFYQPTPLHFATILIQKL